MLAIMRASVETLERSTTKNIATKVALVCMQKINYIKNIKLGIY